ncbi:MAG: methionyl-tRNA formyltransferase [Bacteriovoracia bacterium]
MTPFRIVFMGTPEFAVPSLQALLDRPDLAIVVAVYTQPDRPAGRGQKMHEPPIKQLAKKHGIPVFQPENINEPDEKRKFADLMMDYAVVAAYAQFLSPGILNTPRICCLNVHASLLPKYRGASPIQQAILDGESKTGISIIRLVPKMDAGPIFHQEVLEIPKDATAEKLSKMLSTLGADALIRALELSQQRKLEEKDQDESQVSYAYKISKADGLISWDKPAEQILRMCRAYTPWPGCYTKTKEGTLKIHSARLADDSRGLPATAQPGSVNIGSGSFLVKCADRWIELLEVQPEGKKVLSISDYLNGIKDKAEVRFL